MLLLFVLLLGTSKAYNLPCHCFNGSACDSNGFCASGCENGWHGPGCQVGNVALGKQASQSTTFEIYGYVCSADRAVDGNWPSGGGVASCSHTLPAEWKGYPLTAKELFAWWVVTLDKENYYVIFNVTLVNRRDEFKSRLRNFFILYSNDTENNPDPTKDTWHTCAEEYDSFEYSRTYRCKNAATAKRVAIYLEASSSFNPTTILTLCEVQIFGYEYKDCPSGYTGPGCLLRACDQCEKTGGKCTGDYGSCHYDECPEKSLLPPDCWIKRIEPRGLSARCLRDLTAEVDGREDKSALSNFSGLSIQSSATCNNLLFSADLLPASQANIAASLLQLQVAKSSDLQQVLENVELLLRTSNTAYYNFSRASADTVYTVSVKLLYCDRTGKSCFHTSESEVFTMQTGRREYNFSRNISCFLINVNSATINCEHPSVIQVTCESQVTNKVTVNSSGLSTCGLHRDQGYNCSINAFIDANESERRSAYISAAPLSEPPGTEENFAVLGGSVGGSIAVTAIIVVFVSIVFCRRQIKTKLKTDALKTSEVANRNVHEAIDARNATSVPSTTSARLVVEENKQIYYNTSGMNLSQFQMYVLNESLIAQRYSELQANESHPCILGRSPENKGKNRFQNILPYDLNRVQLAYSAHDYINASYINGFSKSNEYIAAQGPTPKTVDDFWQMLWQEKCSTVVMLTDYVEHAKKKCEKYFPYSKSHGINMEVTVRSSVTFDTYTVTVLNVRQGSDARLVHHFHFLAWPDQSVPSHNAEMLLFYNRLRLHLKRQNSGGPLVVHCSAGVGRTGAYIAFDYLQQRYHSECTVDVDSCVVRLRDQRMLMVQTKEQYVFLHRAVLYGMRTMRHIYDAAMLPVFDPNGPFPDGCVSIEVTTEWHDLQTLRPTFHEQSFASAVLPENRSKNRRSQILALESKRPLLSRPEDGSSLYINAVHCNGCYSNRAFIATQVPLHQTVADFWLMVYECQPSCILLLHDLPDSDDEEDCQRYWPEPGHSITLGWLEVKCDVTWKDDSTTNARMSGLDISLSPVSGRMTASQTVSTKLFTTSLWDFKWSAELPASAKDVLEVTNALRTYCVQAPRQPIIVQCRDGATQSGLFLSVMNALLRLIETEQVSVFHTVDLLRASRPEFVTSEAQYRFIYNILELYRKSSSVYANY